MDDLKWIKKHYSESLAHICRDEFPSLLETEGLLSSVLEKTFAYSKALGDDLKDPKVLEDFKNIIYNAIDNEKKDDKDDIIKDEILSPFVLMKQAGYTLYPECKTEADIQTFRHYYHRKSGQTPIYKEGEKPKAKNGEELCTFNGDRLEYCRVWFAVKDNAKEIKREDFTKPEREDEYGTSVISIQFSKGKLSTLSIKNRYNHTVKNPDATFNCNLDNITPNLTIAFQKAFNLNIDNYNLNTPKNYVLAQDGKFYRSNIEFVGVNYCENNIIINAAGEIEKLPPHKLLVDNFIIDTQTNEITNDENCFFT